MKTITDLPSLVERAKFLFECMAQFREELHRRDELGRQQKITAVSAFLNEATPHIERLQRGAPHFNMFLALGVVRKELVQSRFLAFLLSPKAGHGMNALFLNAFLNAIGLPSIESCHAGQIQVHTELTIGNGRIDVFVKGKNFIIAIENKVDAGEQDEQLGRYRYWLDQKSHRQNFVNRELIFLTPSGHDSVTAEAIEYKKMSYLELATVFDHVIDKIDVASVRSAIEQYITACRMVSLGMFAMTKLDPELLKLLTSPEHLVTALEVQSHMALVRENAAKTFATNVSNSLQLRLEAAGLRGAWLSETPVPGEDLSSVYIRLGNQTDARKNYCVMNSGTVMPDGSGWYGWRWPQKPFEYRHPDCQHEANLAKRMSETDASKTDGEAIWFKALRNGLGAFDIASTDDMVIVVEDNQSQHHPQAESIANEMWQVFIDWKDAIMATPSCTASLGEG